MMKDMSVAVASQQVEVFSKVFKTSISKFVQDGVEMQQKNLDEIIVSPRNESVNILKLK